MILDVYDRHEDYQKSIYHQLCAFSIDDVDSEELKSLNEILKTRSLFYSFCLDRYNLLPSIICSLGYSIVILVSDSLLVNIKDIIKKEIERISILNGKKVQVQFFTNTTPNLLFKLKSEVSKDSKVLMFADGNKGNANEKINNLHVTDFKGYKIMFHQGFGALNYILQNNQLTGLIARGNESKIELEVLTDNLDSASNMKKYMSSVSELLVRRLDDIITIENIHLWNNLLSVFEWFIIDENKFDPDKAEYVPFTLNRNEYYALEHDTFKAYPLTKKEYKNLKKELSL